MDAEKKEEMQMRSNARTLKIASSIARGLHSDDLRLWSKKKNPRH